MSADVDVVVVGGGLAGCSTAIHLASQGQRVVLLEAKAFPHDKVCGEFLSPECRPLLEDLGVMPAIRVLKPTSISQAHITVPDGHAWTTTFPAPGLGISRYRLDAALAERTRSVGAEVMEQSNVAAIDGDLESGFLVSYRSALGSGQLTARVVIGAHGKRSIIDRALRRRFINVPQPFVALKAHFYGLPIPDRVDLHAFPGGYCGMSEVEGGKVNLCLLVRQPVFARFGGNISDFVRWMRAQNPFIDTWMQNAELASDRWLTIAQVPFVAKPPIDRDVLMAGDSAGLIAPLAGDGMAMALHSGVLAASHVDRFLGGQLDAKVLRHDYAKEWKRRFAARLRLGRTLQIIMLRPRWLALGLRALHAVPELGEYVINNTRDMRVVRL